MRDEHSQESIHGDHGARERDADGTNVAAPNEAAGPDAATSKSRRWVPLAYDIEQNSDAGLEGRREVF
jgi:hypothetical protein